MPRNRSFPPHLVRRPSGLFWRRRLPISHHAAPPASNRQFLCFSLRTHVIRDAKVLTRRLTEMSDLIFAANPSLIATDRAGTRT